MSYWSCLPVRRTFLRHARDGKAYREAIARTFKLFFRPAWEGRNILVAISGLTNLCIVFQMARYTRQKKDEPGVLEKPRARQGGSIT